MAIAMLPLIAVLLAAFGLWTGLNGAVLLVSGGTPLLMLLFIAQGVLALVAAYGVARAAAWAPPLLLLLGALVAATLLIEAFVLGILPWLYAVVIGAVAIVLAIVVGGLVRGAGGPPHD